MTFTRGDLEKGKILHADLGRLLQERKSAGKGDIGSKLSYLLKKDDVRSFWLRHGEDALVALEEARGEIDALEDELSQAETKLGYAMEQYEMMARRLRAAEEGHGE